MLIVLSPAKMLIEPPAVRDLPATQPRLLDQAEKLVAKASKMKPAQLGKLMSISDKLSQLNFERYQAWSQPFDANNARQALLSFNGGVYQGLDAATLEGDDLDWAQQHVAILSGLYGVLRPLDLMQPYRLEMGTKLTTRRGKSLYDFWGNRITDHLNAWLDGQDDKTVVNLASNEYFKSVKAKQLAGPVITPVFKDVKDGKARTIFLFAKRARGLMTRWAIQNRISSPAQLKSFDSEDYRFDASDSNDTRWVFKRPQPPPVNG